MANYIVNEDISWHLIEFVSFRCSLMLAQLNSYFNMLMKSVPFYQEWMIVHDETTDKLTICYKKGLLHLLIKLKNSCQSVDCLQSYVYAAHHNQLNVLQWCLDQKMEVRYLNKAINGAAFNGHIQILQWFKQHVLSTNAFFVPKLKNMRYYKLTIRRLLANNRLDILQWFHNVGLVLTFSRSQIDTLIQNKQFVILKWLSDIMPLKYSYQIVIWAASTGCLDTLKWLHTINHKLLYPCEVMNAAIENNQISVLNWLSIHKCISYSNESITIAVKRKHYQVCQWFIHQKIDTFRYLKKVIKAAILYDAIEILQHFYPLVHRLYCFDKAIYGAAVKGHFQLLSWLKEMGLSVRTNYQIMLGAIQNNQLEIVQLIDKNTLKPKYVKRLIKAAVKNNQLGMLYYLKNTFGIQCSKKLIRIAANRGYLAVLDWFNDECKPFKYNVKAIEEAAKQNRLAVLDWFKLKGYFKQSYHNFVDNVTNRGHVEVLHWFKQHTQPFIYTSRAIDNAAAGGQISVLDWFKNSGYPFIYSSRAIDNAAAAGEIPVLNWFKNNRYPFIYTNRAIIMAAKYRLLTVLLWFQSNKYQLHCSLQELSSLCQYYDLNEPIIDWFDTVGFDTTGYNN